MNELSPCLPWKSIVPSPMQGKVESILRDMAGWLWEERGRYAGSPDILSGVALFHGFLAKRDGFGQFGETAEALMEEAVGAIGPGIQPWLFSGLAGIGFRASCLGKLLDWEIEEMCAEVDQITLQSIVSPESRMFDLISGRTGFGVYGLERDSSVIVEAAIAWLDAVAMRGEDGTVAWTFTPEEANPTIDLGLAHGLAGVMTFLAGAWARGYSRGTAERLLKGTVRWLEKQLLPAESGTAFPHAASWLPAPLLARNRVAWCYGDLGIGLGLTVAASHFPNETLVRLAQRAAHDAALRPMATSGAMDVYLCHGTAGNAHLFHRLFQMNGDPHCYEAARMYLDWTVELHSKGGPVCGFPVAYDPPGATPPPPLQEFSLLEGVPGVGLALLASLGGVDPAWDRMLLASPPGR